MNKTLLSICIPTFNRLECLDNCLKSIKVASENYKFNFEVCIKDNNSEGNAYSIVKKYQNCFKIKYQINKKILVLEKIFFFVSIMQRMNLAGYCEMMICFCQILFEH